jgi:hypothetical protein
VIVNHVIQVLYLLVDVLMEVLFVFGVRFFLRFLELVERGY